MAKRLLILVTVVFLFVSFAGVAWGDDDGPKEGLKHRVEALEEQVQSIMDRVTVLEDALNGGSGGAQRTVYDVVIDPAAPGDETYSWLPGYGAWCSDLATYVDVTRTIHFKKIVVEGASMADPPLVHLMSYRFPGMLYGGPGDIQLIDGGVLIPYKQVASDSCPSNEDIDYPYDNGLLDTNGMAHFKLVVVK